MIAAGTLVEIGQLDDQGMLVAVGSCPAILTPSPWP